MELQITSSLLKSFVSLNKVEINSACSFSLFSQPEELAELRQPLSVNAINFDLGDHWQ